MVLVDRYYYLMVSHVVTLTVASGLNVLHHKHLNQMLPLWYLLMVNHMVAIMVASGLNANDAKHLNWMLLLGYHTADCQQVPTIHLNWMVPLWLLEG